MIPVNLPPGSAFPFISAKKPVLQPVDCRTFYFISGCFLPGSGSFYNLRSIKYKLFRVFIRN
jgi:hypothetical protein